METSGWVAMETLETVSNLESISWQLHRNPGAYQSNNASQRIHSSADEISSLNHSPSISSSDESYSRTTDADASPCVSPPLLNAAGGDTNQYLFPSDIQVNPCSSSPEVSPRASLDYIPPNCSLRNNNSTDRPPPNGGSMKRNNLPPNAVLALAATCNTVDSSLITSPPTLDGDGCDSYRGESCASFEFLGRPKQLPLSIRQNGSNNGAISKKQKNYEKAMQNIYADCDKLSAVCQLSSPGDMVLVGNDSEEHAQQPTRAHSSDRTDTAGAGARRRDQTPGACCAHDGGSRFNVSVAARRASPGASGVCNNHRRVEKLSPCGFVPISANKTSISEEENNQEPFEREIQKLLEEQNLLQNIPPKTELGHQSKDIGVEPLNKLDDRGHSPAASVASNIPNSNHQVGLAAIQALALGLRVNVNNSAVPSNQISPPQTPNDTTSVDASYGASTSVLRSKLPVPVATTSSTALVVQHQQRQTLQRIDKTDVVEDTEDCRLKGFQRTHLEDETDIESFERVELLMEQEAAEHIDVELEAEVKRLLEEKVQERLRVVDEEAAQLLCPDSSQQQQLPSEVTSSANRQADPAQPSTVSESNDVISAEKVTEVDSPSEWSEDDEEEEGGASEPLLNDRESTGYTTDDPALENISMLNETGLTDAEGALSDVNSAYHDRRQHRRAVDDEDGGGLAEGGCGGLNDDCDDNTSMSSRASSRIFDSDAMMSLDSLSALYDSEYDNCYRTDDDLNALPDLDRLNYFPPGTVGVVGGGGLVGSAEGAVSSHNEVHLANIRSMSESITRNFGQPAAARSETDPDSEDI